MRWMAIALLVLGCGQTPSIGEFELLEKRVESLYAYEALHAKRILKNEMFRYEMTKGQDAEPEPSRPFPMRLKLLNELCRTVTGRSE